MQQKNKNKKQKYLGAIYLLPLFLIVFALFLGASGEAIPDRFYPDDIQPNDSVSATVTEKLGQSEESGYTAKVFGVIPAKNIDKGISKNLTLVPCGDVFGVKFFTKGVVITGISEVESREGIISPAAKAGLKTGDVILSVNGREINTVEEMTDAVESSDGSALEIEFVRDDKNYKSLIYPIKALSDESYKAGLWVRDNTAGTGTCTYYDPSDGSFAALGHGIYDADANLLMPLLKGAVVEIRLEDIIKGREGHPGELKGSFGSTKIGSLVSNNSCGIFGVLTEAPSLIKNALPVGIKTDVKEGAATILSNVDGLGIEEYDIEISKIYSGNEKTKNFVIKVSDPDLLEKTGGIVRGMSGSPIIQNGKLIGAVTHVMVNDPTKGYGIFIENMLAEAEKIK